jgi:hypothetical protein
MPIRLHLPVPLTPCLEAWSELEQCGAYRLKVVYPSLVCLFGWYVVMEGEAGDGLEGSFNGRGSFADANSHNGFRPGNPKFDPSWMVCG